MKDWGDPVSKRARQFNRDVVETPLWSDNRVVNVASSMVTTPDDAADQIRSLFGYEGRVNARSLSQKYLWGVVVGHRIGVSPERGHLCVGARGVRVETEMGDWVYFENRIVGSVIVARRRISRACSKACPRRFWPHQESGQEARGSRALRPMPHMAS